MLFGVRTFHSDLLSSQRVRCFAFDQHKLHLANCRKINGDGKGDFRRAVCCGNFYDEDALEYFYVNKDCLM